MSKNNSSPKNPLTPTTIKIATLTGAAKDDVFELSEGTGIYELDVLANDPGSAKLYSLAQFSGLSKEQLPVLNSITLSGGTTQFGAGAGFRIEGGEVSIQDGKLIYANENAQALREGETLTESFTYTVRMANGALSQATASFTITGENDLATIEGDNSGSLIEDEITLATGTLIVNDVDHGESRFADLADGALIGTYGTFEFDVLTGDWKYVLDNSSDAVQGLNTGDTVYDTLVVSSFDGTATETIKVEIVGKDEPITGSEPEPSAGKIYVVNHGKQFINGVWTISGFEDDSILLFAGTEYRGFDLVDTNGDGSEDTTVVSSYRAKGAGAGTGEVILVGYTNFDPSTQVQLSNSDF
jgi:VCBS repeat-containing protein